MTEHREVYRCNTCHAMAVVLRGGAGALACCGAPMALYQENTEHPDPAQALPLNVPTMEHNLAMPVKTVIEIIQRRLTQKSHWCGVPAIKSPTDFWVYCEMIYEIRPDVIVEIGTKHGGGALSMGHFCDNIDHGRIITVDIDHSLLEDAARNHPRVEALLGDGCAMLDEVKARIQPGETVLVIEDSSHTYENTLNVMRAYAPLVTLGSYLIVEDSNCYHGLDEGFSPGPYEAIEQFITETDAFAIDRERENFFITWNPKGYLRRVK